MPAAMQRFPPSYSRAIRPAAGASRLSPPCILAGAGYRQVRLGTSPSDSTGALCYKADSPLPSYSLELPELQVVPLLALAFRSSHSFASFFRSCLGLSARPMLQRCQEFDLQLLPSPFTHVGSGRGAEKAGKR